MSLFEVIRPLFPCRKFAVLLLLSVTAHAHGTDIDLVALSNGKAMLIVDGKAPKNYTIGTNITSTIKLIAADRDSATIEIDGKKQLLQLGRTSLQPSMDTGNKKIILQANELGHFLTNGQINGGSSVRMLVDTGASFIALPASEAQRLGIDYRNKGILARTSTANGVVPIYRVRLDSVKIGEIEILQVDAAVHEGDLPITLLGMSFLKRVTMLREGQQMTLTKKN
ncbi:retroviral-like aspartic protease family protein [Undibacterium sp. LX40W]|uniref:Retroviral-like aspartic protease family protein n=1 Tax=Undibacterium nitidum TaxID=2762298 RepID=A0A923KJX1_9BURK|nr:MULTISPECIES: retropepsin-like aspartic protease [Undibacterium]MBC3880125.1 retroviral-like aspartic protease family protein [Undibacterium nitidum]MBC3891139.1 retroviral-like aspartic protease family protein [Undibacterium sp. LX40W]